MGVEDDDGDAAAGVEAEGGVRDGVGDGAVSREVAATSREAVPRLGSLTVQNQILPRLGFRVGGGTPLIPDTLLVSADVIPIIFCIGWLTSADTNKAQPINTAHTPLF
jgi:hypothetical protein